MPAGRLSLLELNRATLERQLLLRREAQPALCRPTEFLLKKL